MTDTDIDIGIETEGRCLGIDLGTKRIGIATCDARRTLASPLLVLQRSGNVPADHRRIATLVREEEAVRVVVGVPVALSGKEEQAAQTIRQEIVQLQKALDVPVSTADERMTSAAAHAALRLQGLNEKQRRNEIDQYAAAQILQGWLDAQP